MRLSKNKPQKRGLAKLVMAFVILINSASHAAPTNPSSQERDLPVPQGVSSGDPQGGQTSITPGISKVFGPLAQNDLASVGMLKAAEALEEGRVDQLPSKDPFFETGQSVTVEKVVYDLNSQSNPIQLGITKDHLKIKQRVEGSMLHLEGYYGTNDRGENGRLYATHTIDFQSPIVVVSSITDDSQLLLVVTKDGSIHGINQDLLKDSVFETEITCFSRLWTVDGLDRVRQQKWSNLVQDLENNRLEFRASFITRGSPLNLFNRLSEALVYPTNPEEKNTIENLNSQMFEAGSFYLAYRNKDDAMEDWHPVAFLDRKFILVGMIFGALIKQVQAMVVNPPLSSKIPQITEQIKKAEALYQIAMAPVRSTDLSVWEQFLLGKASPERLEKFGKAVEVFHSQVKQAGNVDRFDREEVAAFLSKAVTRVSQQTMDDPFQIERDWQEIAKKLATKPMEPILKPDSNLTNLFMLPLKEISRLFNKIIPNKALRKNIILTVTAGVTLGYPYFYQHTGIEIPLLSTLYHYLYPPILKDQMARNSAIAGLLAGLAFIPLATLSAQVVQTVNQKVILKLSQNGKGPLFEKLREFAKQWGNDSWLRVLGGMSLRISALFTYPIIRFINNTVLTISDKVLRQRTLASAIELGLSPFAPYQSSEGKQGRIGFNSPFLSKKELEQIRKEKIDYQTKLVEVQTIRERLSLSLAIQIVSEQYGLSPGLIMTTMGQTNRTSTELDRLYSDPMKAKAIHSLDFAILSELERTPPEILLDVIKNEQKFFDHYKKAKALSEELSHSSNAALKNTLKLRWYETLALLKMKWLAASNFGYSQFQANWHLKPIEIPEEPLKFTNWEFRYDTVIVAGLGALVGPFADPSRPDRLFGSTQFPFLGPTGATAMLNNTAGHLLLSMPLNITTGGGENPRADLSDYQPIENLIYPHNNNEESFSSTFINEWKQILDFKKSDFGGYYMNYFLNFWKYIQFNSIVQLSLRMGLFGMDFKTAFGSFILGECLNFIFYRHQWAWLRVGGLLNIQRYRENNSRIEDFKRISQQLLKQWRKGESNETAMWEAYQRWLTVYLKEDPKLLEKLYLLMSKTHPEIAREMVNIHPVLGGRKGFASFQSYGILVQYLNTVKTLKQFESSGGTDTETLQGLMVAREKLEAELIQSETAFKEFNALGGTNNRQPELIAANLDGLFELTRSSPPLKTKTVLTEEGGSNPYQELMTFSFGAIGTTLIGNLVTDLTTTPENMSNPVNLVTWTLYSIATVIGVWAATSTKALDFHAEVWKKTKASGKMLPLLVAEKIKDKNEIKSQMEPGRRPETRIEWPVQRQIQKCIQSLH